MEQPSSPATTPVKTFYAVPVAKFVILAILSAGLYPLYWFWYNWKLIREQEKKEYSPILRALFSFLYFADLARIALQAATAKQYQETYNPTILAWIYFIGILASVSGSLIGSIVTIIGFCMIVPVLRAMNYTNSHTEGGSIQTKLTSSELIVTAIGIGIWILNVRFALQQSFGP
jgi:hypothetical protein